jgi:hypothetical protein
MAEITAIASVEAFWMMNKIALLVLAASLGVPFPNIARIRNVEVEDNACGRSGGLAATRGACRRDQEHWANLRSTISLRLRIAPLPTPDFSRRRPRLVVAMPTQITLGGLRLGDARLPWPARAPSGPRASDNTCQKPFWRL